MSICKECGGITSEYSGTPCTCPVVVPPAPTVVEAHSVEYKREYARAGREFAGSDESMFSCGYAYGVIVGKQAAQIEIDRLKAWQASMLSVQPDMQAIGNALGLRLGESIHDKILPGIELLTRQRDGLKEALVAVRGWIGHLGSDQVVGDIIEKALTAAKETNDR